MEITRDLVSFGTTAPSPFVPPPFPPVPRSRPTVEAQSTFETSIFPKVMKTPTRSEANILVLDDCLVVYQCVSDTVFLVTGSLHENELILSTVLDCFTDAVQLVLHGQVDKRMLLENLDLLCLVMDEITDDGLILETDSLEVADKVAMRSEADEGGLADLGGKGGLGGIAINEQAVQAFVGNLQGQIRTFLRS